MTEEEVEKQTKRINTYVARDKTISECKKILSCLQVAPFYMSLQGSSNEAILRSLLLEHHTVSGDRVLYIKIPEDATERIVEVVKEYIATLEAEQEAL